VHLGEGIRHLLDEEEIRIERSPVVERDLDRPNPEM
jgi:hypothetical protein